MGSPEPATTFDVTDYGADASTATAFEAPTAADGDVPVVTEGFNAAVTACADAGGGTVLVPPGEYVSGTLLLESDVTIHLESGATVYASAEREEYSDERLGPDGERVFLWADEVENVAITGRGRFHGRGTEIMLMDTPIRGHSGESSSHPLITSGPHEARQGEDYLDRDDGTDDWPVAKPDFRPGPMFRFDHCENVLVRDVELRDMPSWTIGLHGTTEADVLGVDVRGNKLIPNNDGIAVTDSRNVHISDCTFVTCDDSICMNGTSEVDQPCENVTVTNCTIESNACAIKFGSGTDGPMRDFTFQNIVIRDSNRGLGIQHRDSGTLENVLFSDIFVQTRLLSGPWWGKAEPIYVTSLPREEDTDLGTVRNVRFSNVVAQCENGAVVYGSDEATIENVSFENVSLEIGGSENSPLTGGNFDMQPTTAKTAIFERDVAGVHCENASGVDLEDVTVEWVESGGTTANAVDGLPDYYSHGLQCTNVSDLAIDGFDGRQAHADSDAGAITLRDVETVSVRDSRARPGTRRFLERDGVADPRLFAGNDLTDAETSGLADESGDGSGGGFTMSGNRLPL